MRVPRRGHRIATIAADANLKVGQTNRGRQGMGPGRKGDNKFYFKMTKPPRFSKFGKKFFGGKFSKKYFYTFVF